MLALANTVANTIFSPFQHIGRNVWTPTLTEISLLPLTIILAHDCLVALFYVITSRPERGNVAKWRPFLALSRFSALRYLTQLLTNLYSPKTTI
jgi:hypothetical protein